MKKKKKETASTNGQRSNMLASTKNYFLIITWSSGLAELKPAGGQKRIGNRVRRLTSGREIEKKQW
jgi:hypothetical protein